MDNLRNEPQGAPTPGPGEDHIERSIRELIRLLKDQILAVPQQPPTSTNGVDKDESPSEQSEFEAACLPEPGITEWNSLPAFLEHQRSKYMVLGSADDLAFQSSYARSLLQTLVFRSLGQTRLGLALSDDLGQILQYSNLCNIKYVHGPKSFGSVWYVRGINTEPPRLVY